MNWDTQLSSILSAADGSVAKMRVSWEIPFSLEWGKMSQFFRNWPVGKEKYNRSKTNTTHISGCLLSLRYFYSKIIQWRVETNTLF